jgi:hypothetical protein
MPAAADAARVGEDVAEVEQLGALVGPDVVGHRQRADPQVVVVAHGLVPGSPAEAGRLNATW